MPTPPDSRTALDAALPAPGFFEGFEEVRTAGSDGEIFARVGGEGCGLAKWWVCGGWLSMVDLWAREGRGVRME